MSTDELFYQQIKESPSIVIFSHHFPDGDCLGSMNGLRRALRALFPEKKIYGLAERSKKWEMFFECGDEVSDDVIADSLAIIVDHNSMDRVCDKRVRLAKKGIRFDHHIGGKVPYSFPALCDIDACSASEVILKWFLRLDLPIPTQSVQDFYIAFLDDTLQYTVHNAPAQLNEIDAAFQRLGGDKEKASYAVAYKSPAVAAYEGLIKQRRVERCGIAYAIMKEEDYLPLDISYEEVGAKSTVLGEESEADVLLLFTHAPDEIRLSARSRKDFSVEALCKYFGGGGHIQAAGAVFPPNFDCLQVIEKALAMKGF